MSEYNLLDKQTEFMEIPHDNPLDVAIYQGGYGSGKTWCGALLGIILAKKYPKSRGLVGAKEYELVRKTTLVTYLEHLEALGYKEGIHYKYNKNEKIIKFKNGSEILFSSLDDQEKFKSLNLHWAEIEEASQIDDSSFKQLLGRLRNTYRGKDWVDFRFRLFGHTNPQADKGWIYERFVENPKENFRLIIAPTTNNIYLPEHFIQSLRDNFDEEYYKINVLGEFGNYNSGLVVKGFSDENIKKINYCPDLPVHLTCDFNVDPMMWLVAHKDDESAYYFDEIVIENTTTEQCIKEFIRRYPNHKADIIINGDASGDNRSTQSEYTNYAIIRRELYNHGYDKKQVKFKLRDYNPPILNRIASFNARVKNSKGERRLFVDKRCKYFLKNIYNLKYKEGTSIIDAPTIHTLKKDRDKKFMGHIFDAGSYLTEYYWRIK
ncbi:MAG: phage terminase large subunit [Cyanobacteria bacterium RUI128]|nr:phage terminase large subunit [Cyanobacteria bacterium RUI128]